MSKYQLRPAVLTAIAMATAAGAAAPESTVQVAVRQVEEHKFEFLLTNPTPLSEQQAQGIVAAVARSACRERAPQLGKFRFESTQTLEGGGQAASADSFRFVQEVSCGPATTAQPDIERRPILQSAEESQRVQEEIRTKSRRYFQDIASGRLAEAFAVISAERLGVSQAAWEQNKQSFRAMAGGPVNLTIAKLTVYDNPASAAEPGLYVAADYVNEFRNAPIHCGYLMWFRAAGGEFRIIREETGHVTADQIKSIPADQLAEIRRRMRCVT